MNAKVVSEYESVSTALSGIAGDAERIARGLENLAPVAANAATGSIHYLHAAASQLELDSSAIMQKGQPGGSSRPSFHELTDLVGQILKSDTALREKFEVGQRFQFIHERLHILHSSVELLAQGEESGENVKEGGKKDTSWVGQPVYVYLYNAEGAVLRTWTAMLTPRAFYEYSVNRPVYAEKTHVESIIALKPNPQQHAYVTIAVRPEDIVRTSEAVIKVKEGALTIEKLILFTHNGQDFVFEQGELVRKIQ